MPAQPPTAILAVDIGGTHTKASVLDPAGNLLHEPLRFDTPVNAPPQQLVEELGQLAPRLPPFDRIAVGWPGVVRNHRVRTAPLLHHPDWPGFPLAEALTQRLGHPCRLGNDADIQGFAVIAGKGLEMVITLGTGFGSALYETGRLGPHLELAHHPFRDNETYNQQVGDAARKRIGDDAWRQRVELAVQTMRTLTLFDHLYIGGGNSRLLPKPTTADITLVDNVAGIRGGAWLWRND